jgi:hypothetical protein
MRMTEKQDTQSETAPERRVAKALRPANPNERVAIRNVSVLLLLRGLILAGGAATATVVPRTLGPATYGRYDLVTMLTFWFTMLGSLGTAQIVSRQTPQLEHERALGQLRALFSKLFMLRALTSVVAAVLYLLAIGMCLRDVEWPVLLVLSLAVLLRGPGSLCYALFLGQGRIGRWAIPEVVRQWGSIAFTLPCYLLDSVEFIDAEGAKVALLLRCRAICLLVCAAPWWAISSRRRSSSRLGWLALGTRFLAQPCGSICGRSLLTFASVSCSTLASSWLRLSSAAVQS